MEFNEKIDEDKVKKRNIFYVLSFIILFAFFFLVIFLRNSGNAPPREIVVDEESQGREIEAETSLSHFFEEKLDSETNEGEDEFLISDPFREICASTSGDELPSISGSTVCLR